MVIDPLAAEKRGLRKRDTSSIGRSLRASTLMNTASSARPSAKAANVDVDAQPQSGAWMMAKTSVPIAAHDSTSPGQSMGDAAGSFDVGTEDATPKATRAARGTMNKKTLPHQ